MSDLNYITSHFGVKLHPKESDEMLKTYLGKELVIFWENEIPYKFFAQDFIFNSDGELINEFYRQISTN